ncbi:MAG: hypothetical protein V4671_04025 [Armatimonadota bacterium]
MSNTDTTTRLIKWQRITISVLFLAFISTALAAGYQAHLSEARLKENRQLRQRVSQYETERRQFRRTPEDIEYLQWFKAFDQSCRTMSKQQAELIGRELHSSEEDSLEPVTTDATNQWRQYLVRFRQKSPPHACEALAAAYAERLSLMTGQVQNCVSWTKAISSRLYSMDSPQGRKWIKTPGVFWESERRNAETLRLRATTTYLNVELDQIARTPGIPLPQDLAKLRVRWVGVFLD